MAQRSALRPTAGPVVGVADVEGIALGVGSHLRDGELAIAKPSVWNSRRVGKLEAYICAGCMLVEWHVKELEGLDEHVDVSVLDGEAPRQGPYR
ncbi:hypothetical protein WMF30_37135 [Sorangium sp. So ce134]